MVRELGKAITFNMEIGWGSVTVMYANDNRLTSLRKSAYINFFSGEELSLSGSLFGSFSLSSSLGLSLGSSLIIVESQLNFSLQELNLAKSKEINRHSFGNLCINETYILIHQLSTIPFQILSLCTRNLTNILSTCSSLVQSIGFTRVVGRIEVGYQWICSTEIVCIQREDITIPRIILSLCIAIYIKYYIRNREDTISHDSLSLGCIISSIYICINQTHIHTKTEGIGKTLPAIQILAEHRVGHIDVVRSCNSCLCFIHCLQNILIDTLTIIPNRIRISTTLAGLCIRSIATSIYHILHSQSCHYLAYIKVGSISSLTLYILDISHCTGIDSTIATVEELRSLIKVKLSNVVILIILRTLLKILSKIATIGEHRITRNRSYGILHSRELQ